MKITTVRRICQAFFLFLMIWFCVVTTFGVRWWELRGWPVNWFFQLDPLVALGTILTTGTLFNGLVWALVTLVITVFVGRFFCGWVCPFGTIQHLAGYWGKRGESTSERISVNRYHPYQSLKYYLLLFLLSAAGSSMAADIVRHNLPDVFSVRVLPVVFVLIVAFAGLRTKRDISAKKAAGILFALLLAWFLVGSLTAVGPMIGSSLQSGLLDPISLLHRSINLVLLPLADAGSRTLFVGQRYFEGAWVIGAIFFSVIILTLKIPRFYCRFICPLGALFGVLSHFSLWRIFCRTDICRRCGLCEINCEGACDPLSSLRASECILCMNCLYDCQHEAIGFGTRDSDGAIGLPDLSRRGTAATVFSGIAMLPMLKLNNLGGANYPAHIIRPPGALPEVEFLKRCIKCGQCMRICPTNVIQPAGFEAGVEGVWTPVLNFRIGTSGCQLNCTACSYVCPTAAIRPISLDEKTGRDTFRETGPIRIGTAFLDHGRCLPWAMDTPCIVCQENCPVSPKAIFVREVFQTVRDGHLRVHSVDSGRLSVNGSSFQPGELATGDFYVLFQNEGILIRRRIVANNGTTVEVDTGETSRTEFAKGAKIEIQVRLQRPYIDVKRCIGCGICEHECPVSGRKAIRISAENESRHRNRSLMIRETYRK